jgi:hypothetical protein
MDGQGDGHRATRGPQPRPASGALLRHEAGHSGIQEDTSGHHATGANIAASNRKPANLNKAASLEMVEAPGVEPGSGSDRWWRLRVVVHVLASQWVAPMNRLSPPLSTLGFAITPSGARDR